MRLIMGIDPGSRVTGWGIIENNLVSKRLVDFGVIPLKETCLSQRLYKLAQELNQIIKKYQPQDLAIEKIFLGKNADSAFKLGHARGVCMMCAAQNKLEVYEYAARKVKQVLTGSGSATKEQVQRLTLMELKASVKIPLDASDALSLAMCHVVEQQVISKLKQAEKGVSL